MSLQRCWILCTVVDNFGDAGVCWRLARQLSAEQAMAVTLFIDRPQTLAALEPRLRTELESTHTLDAVHIRTWPQETTPEDLPDILISAFGCHPPAWLRARLARAPSRPIWVNLEYLSAEPWVEGCHRLISTKPDDGAVEHFFYPGFTPGTGGLLRERGLLERVDEFRRGPARQAWLRQNGLPIQAGRRLASLFCYPEAPVAAWLSAIAVCDQPWLVVVPAGVAELAVAAVMGKPLQPGEQASLGSLCVMRLPFLPQSDYDRLLWSSDLNLVRGEDSWVRAHWATSPFIWQAYRQENDAHWPKVEAFIDRIRTVIDPGTSSAPPEKATPRQRPPGGRPPEEVPPEAISLEESQPAAIPSANAPATASAAVRALETMTAAWNGRGPIEPAWAAFSGQLDALSEYFQVWRTHLSQQDDLAAQLARYCRDRL
jgi:uncharacterized repeat protein (TIGR03837 family)